MTRPTHIRLFVLAFAVALYACSTLSTFAGGTATPASAAVPASPSPVPANLPRTGEGREHTCAIVIADTALNIRAAPDPTAKVIGWLLTSQIVEVTGASVNNWLPIQYGTLAGWSNSTFLLMVDCP